MRDSMKTQHKREQSGYGRILRAFVACVGCGTLALPALAGSDEVKRENGIFYIEVEGTPYDMGREHGTVLARQARQAIVDYKKNVEKKFGKENATKICDWAVKQADFTMDIKKHLPRCWEEMQGIATRAGVSMDDLLMLQMYEEIYEAAPGKVGLTAEETFGAGCTAFQANVGEKRFNGQNMDYSGNLQEQQLVTRYEYPDKELLLYTFVGQVGGIGMNSRGVSVFCTTLPQGEKREKGGVGAQYVLRAMLEDDSAGSAIARLEELPRFSTMSYSIADPERSVIVEASPSEIRVREMSASRPFLVETNHIVALDKRFLEKHTDDLEVKDLERMLARAPINMANPMFMTLQSAIVECDGGKCRLYCSAGHDPSREWNKYGF